ncbi:MAG: hypothetical protein CMH41_00545 [Micrococcales bacterium]|nr:hypothetical protein [Micrococcales bacterium]
MPRERGVGATVLADIGYNWRVNGPAPGQGVKEASMSDHDSWPDPSGSPRRADGSEILPTGDAPEQQDVDANVGSAGESRGFDAQSDEQSSSVAAGVPSDQPPSYPTEILPGEPPQPTVDQSAGSTAPGWEVPQAGGSTFAAPAVGSDAPAAMPPPGTSSGNASGSGAEPMPAEPTPARSEPTTTWTAAPAMATPDGTKTGSPNRTIAIAVIAGLIAGLLGGLAAFGVADRMQASGSELTGPVELPQAQADLPPIQEGSVAAIADAALPTVVSLAVEGSGQAATGSGFVIGSDGYLLTNNHVIAGAANGGKITAVFQDGESVEAELVGRNVSYDLGVLKVGRTGLEAAPLGNSDAVRVGAPVVAIGSPLGLSGTVTTGIISALERPVTAGGQGEVSFISALQTDAAINPGNSGGPLLDASGRVIGINSAIATVANQEEAGSIGLGFSIPINQAKRISEEIIETGKASTPIIGVNLDTSFSGTGAKVETVTSGGPSDGSGLKSGDVIVGVDGKPVNDANELVVAIRSRQPGDTVTLEVKGQGDVQVTLGSTDE